MQPPLGFEGKDEGILLEYRVLFVKEICVMRGWCVEEVWRL